MDHNVFKILLAVTGSAGARHTLDLIKALLDINGPYKFQVRVVVTENAKHFFDLTAVPPTVMVYDDQAEWSWSRYGDPVVHIELRNWADVVVIAPLDANSLAKLALGICDNLVTTTIRAMDLAKPLLFCPAMNNVMWDHPITQTHRNTLKSWGFREIPPIVKLSMSGDIGMGGVATPDTIVNEIRIICDEKHNADATRSSQQ